MRIIEFTISVDKMPLFGFLKSKILLKVWKNGEHYKFTYCEPIDEGVDEFFIIKTCM